MKYKNTVNCRRIIIIIMNIYSFLYAALNEPIIIQSVPTLFSIKITAGKNFQTFCNKFRVVLIITWYLVEPNSIGCIFISDDMVTYTYKLYNVSLEWSTIWRRLRQRSAQNCTGSFHLFEELDKYLRTVYVVWVQQNGKNCTGDQGNNVKPDLSGKLQ